MQWGGRDRYREGQREREIKRYRELEINIVHPFYLIKILSS